MTTAEWVETALLAVIICQGAVCNFLEFQMYRIHRERFEERQKWREAKRKQVRANEGLTKKNTVSLPEPNLENGLSSPDPVDSPLMKAEIISTSADVLAVPNEQ